MAQNGLNSILRVQGLKVMPMSTHVFEEARKPSTIGPSWMEGGPVSTELARAITIAFGSGLFFKPTVPVPRISRTRSDVVEPVPRRRPMQTASGRHFPVAAAQYPLPPATSSLGPPHLGSRHQEQPPAQSSSSIASDIPPSKKRPRVKDDPPAANPKCKDDDFDDPDSDAWKSRIKKLALTVNRKAASERPSSPDQASGSVKRSRQ